MPRPTRRRRTDPRDVVRSLVAGAVALAVLLAIAVLIRPEAVEDVLPFLGSDDKPGTSASSGSTPTSAAPAGGASGGGVVVRGHNPTDPGEDGILTATDLEPFALRGSDLGAGWLALGEAAAATQKLIGPCLRRASSPADAHALITSSFRRGGDGPVISATVRDFTEVPRARTSFTKEAAAVRRCVARSAGPDLEPARADPGADQVVATRFTLREGRSRARGLLVAARVEQRTVTVVVLGVRQDDLDVAVDAVRTVVKRLR